MRTFVAAAILITSVCLTITGLAQTKTCQLTITVANLTDRTGTMRVGLITNADNFMGKADIDTVVAVPAEGPLVITFAKLPAGTYAARLHQDLNGDKKLDMDSGRPTEPFGFSKITMLFGPPTFEDASFALTDDTQMKITLISL